MLEQIICQTSFSDIKPARDWSSSIDLLNWTWFHTWVCWAVVKTPCTPSMQTIPCRQRRNTCLARKRDDLHKILSQQNKEDIAAALKHVSLRPPKDTSVFVGYRDAADKNTSYSIYWTSCMSNGAHFDRASSMVT